MRTLALVLTLLLLAPIAQAQEQPGRDQIVIESLDFAGGTLDQFVVTLREMLDPQPINILLRNEAGRIEIPTLELRRVTLDTALQVAVPTRTAEFLSPDGRPMIRWVKLDRAESGRAGTPVYVIDAGSEPAGRMLGGGRERIFEVFGLDRLIGGGRDADGVLEVIDAALSLDAGEPAELRFHADSGILIVRGTHDQVGLVSEVIERLQHDRSRVSDEDRQRAQRIASLEYELQRAEAHLQLSQQQLEVAERGYDRMRDLVDADSAPESELDQAELLLIDRRTSAQQDAAEIQHIREMIELSRIQAVAESGSVAQRLAGGGDQLRERVRMLEVELEELRAENQQLRTDLERSQR